jgi:hypothetical protein
VFVHSGEGWRDTYSAGTVRKIEEREVVVTDTVIGEGAVGQKVIFGFASS